LNHAEFSSTQRDTGCEFDINPRGEPMQR
jgi:hypothetical protein